MVKVFLQQVLNGIVSKTETDPAWTKGMIKYLNTATTDLLKEWDLDNDNKE